MELSAPISSLNYLRFILTRSTPVWKLSVTSVTDQTLFLFHQPRALDEPLFPAGIGRSPVSWLLSPVTPRLWPPGDRAHGHTGPPGPGRPAGSPAAPSAPRNTPTCPAQPGREPWHHNARKIHFQTCIAAPEPAWALGGVITPPEIVGKTYTATRKRDEYWPPRTNLFISIWDHGTFVGSIPRVWGEVWISLIGTHNRTAFFQARRAECVLRRSIPLTF